ERLCRWFGELRDWLVDCVQGASERRELGNHGTWYDVQVVAYSTYVDDDPTARGWLRDVSVPRLLEQIDVDGRQPRELARATPIEYAVFNLFGLVVLAELGARLDVDLWSVAHPKCRPALDCAIDSLVPYFHADLPIGRTTKHRGTFTMFAETVMLLRVAGARLGRDDYETTVQRFALHRPASRANLLVPPKAEAVHDGRVVSHRGR